MTTTTLTIDCRDLTGLRLHYHSCPLSVDHKLQACFYLRPISGSSHIEFGHIPSGIEVQVAGNQPGWQTAALPAPTAALHPVAISRSDPAPPSICVTVHPKQFPRPVVRIPPPPEQTPERWLTMSIYCEQGATLFHSFGAFDQTRNCRCVVKRGLPYIEGVNQEDGLPVGVMCRDPGTGQRDFGMVRVDREQSMQKIYGVIAEGLKDVAPIVWAVGNLGRVRVRKADAQNGLEMLERIRWGMPGEMMLNDFYFEVICYKVGK